jgi:hypothetical protein
VTIEETLAELGFDLVQRRRGGELQYARRSHPYLSWWVIVRGDGTAELQWEFELGAYLQMKGFHVSVQDELSLLIFPKQEARGPASSEWLQSAIAEAERAVGSVDMLAGT